MPCRIFCSSALIARGELVTTAGSTCFLVHVLRLLLLLLLLLLLRR